MLSVPLVVRPGALVAMPFAPSSLCESDARLRDLVSLGVDSDLVVWV